MKEKKKIDFKYELTRNNYVGLLFFALVLASTLYIIRNQTETFQELDPTQKEISVEENYLKEIKKETQEISDLRKYLNKGDNDTFKIYQSNYIYDEKTTTDNINQETMLYIAYKYIENTTDFSKYQKIITCDEASKVNLGQNIYQCGGTKYPNSYYTVNTYITKDLLKQTVKKIFNKNINNYTNFYTTEDNLCYYIQDEYLCVSHQTNPSTTSAEKTFVKAYKYKNKITIVEKYKFIEEGIYYKGFNSKEIGEEYYISTFNKINGKYYWESTEVYKEN